MQKYLAVKVKWSSMTNKWILSELWTGSLEHAMLITTIFRTMEKDKKWLTERVPSLSEKKKGSFFPFSLPDQSKYKKKIMK
jgi:hypothetical protein